MEEAMKASSMAGPATSDYRVRQVLTTRKRTAMPSRNTGVGHKKL